MSEGEMRVRTKGRLGSTKMRVDDPRFKVEGSPALPERFVEIRPGQARALEQIRREFDSGAKVVMVDAPTGSGKTLLGELVRRDLQVERGLYVCTTKSLQAQFTREFTYARALKGAVNYTPTAVSHMTQAREGRHGFGQVTCGDCDRSPARVPLDEQTCSWCDEVEFCPYQVAKRDALGAPVGVLNTAYALAEWNNVGRWGRRELVIADESDLLESSLMGFVELRVPRKWVERLGLEVPKKGSHMTTIWKWLGEELQPALKLEMVRLRTQGGDIDARREAGRVERLLGDVARGLAREEGWVRDNDEEGDRSGDSLVLKPVVVSDVAEEYLWKHADRWLLMTGTLVSADMEAEALGLEEAGIPWASVEMPMEFDVEHRPVRYVPVGSMTRKDQQATMPKMLRTVKEVLRRHPGVNVLIHTHTYALAKETVEYVKVLGDERKVITYTNARDRDRALREFEGAAEKDGAIMVASSMDRGVDLPGDLCRVQIVMKVPMASLGDRQVSERLRARGGQVWYLANTVRTLMQMCGRAVRSGDDWAVTYVLDSHFSKVYGDGRRLGMWPDWWIDGLEVERVNGWL